MVGQLVYTQLDKVVVVVAPLMTSGAVIPLVAQFSVPPPPQAHASTRAAHPSPASSKVRPRARSRILESN